MLPPRRRNLSAAESRYRAVRLAALRAAQIDLVEAGIAAELRLIDESALARCDQWKNRRVDWPWRAVALEWRRDHPDRFELAIWSGTMLCGLAIGRPSPGPSHLSLYYMEGGDLDHPLKGRVLPIVLTVLELYATALDKRELRLVEPFPELIPLYCSPEFGFTLVTPHKQASYCRRSI